MAKRHLILAALALIGVLQPPATVFAETLATAVERAVLNHPEIKARKFSQKAAGAAVDAAAGLSRPRIGVSANAGFYVDPEVVDESYGVAAAASQTLYNGGQIRSEIKRAGANADAAGSRLEDAALVIGLQAAQAYIEVQRAQRIGCCGEEPASSGYSICEQLHGRRIERRHVSSSLHPCVNHVGPLLQHVPTLLLILSLVVDAAR